VEIKNMGKYRKDFDELKAWRQLQNIYRDKKNKKWYKQRVLDDY